MIDVKRFGPALALIALAFAAPAAHAQTTVFSNFGPGNTFNTKQGWTEDGPNNLSAISLGFYFSQGESFTPTSSGSLSGFTIALFNGGDGGTNDAHLFLADGSGGVPGAILESFTLTNLPSQLGATLTPDVVASVSHPFLAAGSTYFLYEKETGTESNDWGLNSIGETGLHTVSRNGGPYVTTAQTQGAFSVQAAAVPEASTTVSLGLLFALGLSGLTLSVIKRRKPSRSV